MAQQVIVFKAPGFVDRFKATLIPGLHQVSSAPDVEPVSAVSSGGEVFVVPARCVFTPEGLRYAEEWSAKSGRPVGEVYIPEALRV